MATSPEILKQEKEILEASLSDEGVKLLLGKINKAADTLPLQAITALLQDDIAKAKRCAYLWDAYKNQVPRVTENIMNAEVAGDITIEGVPKKSWAFFDWLFNK